MNQISEYETSVQKLHTKIPLALNDSYVKHFDDDFVEHQLNSFDSTLAMISDN